MQFTTDLHQLEPTLTMIQICQYCSNTMLYSFSVFLPTIINQIGDWSAAEVQALTIPVYTLGAVTYIVMGRLSDITQYRGPFAIGATLVSITGYCLLIANKSSGLSFAGCFLVAMGCYTAVGTPLAWLTSNNPRYGKRAFASGMQLTVGNSAGVAAPFLFQNAYAPTVSAEKGRTSGHWGRFLGRWARSCGFPGFERYADSSCSITPVTPRQ